jgi:hypothetical protein
MFIGLLPSNRRPTIVGCGLVGTCLPIRLLAMPQSVTLLPPYACTSQIAYRRINAPSFQSCLLTMSLLWLGSSTVPLMHSGPFHSLSPYFRFGIPHSAWILVQSFLMTFLLNRATLARRVILLLAMVSPFLDPSLQLLAAPCSYIPVPTQLPQSYDRHHCSFFFGDFFMLHNGLHYSWIGLNLLCILLYQGTGCRLAGQAVPFRVSAGSLRTVT